jgi:exo-1,4-beta-D-glucosaminidase
MKLSLNEAWEVASSADLSVWHPVDLPATVLAALVENGVHPDPYVGTNLRELPGQGPRAQNFSNHPMPADSPFAVPWWYRKEFEVPPDAPPHLRLQLDGINYRATVWLNGHKIGALVGAYRDFEIDVTHLVRFDAPNVLDIEVQAPDPCDLAITWVDWNPSPPDKNMGVWRDVWLCGSGPVQLRAPFVITKLDGLERARLTVAGDLVNHTDAPQIATVQADLVGRRLTRRFELAPREVVRFELAPVEVEHPRLWWPRFMGDAALHELSIEVAVGDAVSDRDRLQFGIREITSELTENGHALYHINGRPLLIRGAGWATDLLLRRQPERDFIQLEYVKALHLNTIRWEGMLERADILEWCDREGILVISGWCCCDCWEKWDKWSESNHDISAESLRSQIRRVRRHPSMLAWWYGSDFPPPVRVERRYLEVLAEERWPNPVASSAANKPTEVSGRSGLKMEGPYEYVPPSYWLEDTARGGAFGFATEISPGAAIPPIESLRRMLPADHLWPIDDVWSFHAGGQEFHTVHRFVDALTARYGAPRDVDDLALHAQLLTYEGQRAMFEAYTRNKYRATGVVQWMLNNAWPSLIWHLHDYFLRPGGGYFGTQKACEPLHVMYSYDDHTVVVTNQFAEPFHGLVVRARAWDGARTVDRIVTGIDVAADGKTVAMTLTAPERLTFVDLRLEAPDGGLMSSNFYWLPARADVLDYGAASWLHTPTTEHADLSGVRNLPSSELAVRVTRGDGVRVELENVTDRLAFFVQLRLVDASGADVLPVVWNDNYVSLLPGDARTLRAVVPRGGVLPEDVRVELRGINVPTVNVAAEPDEGRQALALDAGSGPAERLPRHQTDRMIASAVERWQGRRAR